jgi:hypothetical protein
MECGRSAGGVVGEMAFHLEEQDLIAALSQLESHRHAGNPSSDHDRIPCVHGVPR